MDKNSGDDKYILQVDKRKENVQPKEFWGKNISAVNVLTGKNGSGKTSLLRFLMYNMGKGIMSMNGNKRFWKNFIFY